MIVSCKSCLKRYLIDDMLIGTQGRSVRCAGCGYSWVQSTDVFDVKLDKPEPISHKKISSRGRTTLITCVIILISMITLGILYNSRHYFINRWPVSQQIFNKLNLNINDPLQGIVFENIIPLQTKEKDQSFLILKGEIYNTSKEIRQLPALKILLYGDCSKLSFFRRILAQFTDRSVAGHCVVEKWQHTVIQSRLMPNERLSFETSPYLITNTALEVAIEF